MTVGHDEEVESGCVGQGLRRVKFGTFDLITEPDERGVRGFRQKAGVVTNRSSRYVQMEQDILKHARQLESLLRCFVACTVVGQKVVRLLEKRFSKDVLVGLGNAFCDSDLVRQFFVGLGPGRGLARRTTAAATIPGG